LIGEETNNNVNNVYKNIEPAGDRLVRRREDDGILRVGYNNMGGISLGKGFQVIEEIESIAECGMDIQGYSEVNKPWTPGNKWVFDMMMSKVFDQHKTAYASSKADHDVRYLPGGNLLTVTGTVVGRYKSQGSDPWGRFSWVTLRGGRDEGVVVITAYRVCHEASDQPGPFTAYSQQYTAMREAGITNPNPRKQILKDLHALIEEKRREGFRPILMMDANGDCNYEKDKDKDLLEFFQEANLVDVYHKRFPEQINTYMYGKKRLDYIVMDPVFEEAVVRIGYLGTHEGTFSDHVQAYVDFDSRKIFSGVVNRPLPLHAREFRLEQSDKVKEFQDLIVKRMEEHKIGQRVTNLAHAFKRHGGSNKNVAKYQKLDEEIKDIALATAKHVARKKYGYMRSPELVIAGRMLILAKMIQDCRNREAPYTEALLKRAATLQVDLTEFDKMTNKEIRRYTQKVADDLWGAQKTCEKDRAEWLRSEAEARAKVGDKDSEQELKDMMRIAESRAVNRKLTGILKPRSGAIDRIQIPTTSWLYSERAREIYHYDQGNFESHPQVEDYIFYGHHSLKVPPQDAVQCSVVKEGDKFRMEYVFRWFYSYERDTLYRRVSDKLVESYHRRQGGVFTVHKQASMPADAYGAVIEEVDMGRYRIVEVRQVPAQLWRDVTSPEEMEEHLRARNKRHLQQVEKEDADSDRHIIKDLIKDHGTSEAADQLLAGEYVPQQAVSKEMAAWIKQMKQSEAEKNSPPIVCAMDWRQYQECFKMADEKTSSSPAGLHYTIWKAMARVESLAKFLCIMISLPFLYGFVNNRWANEIDVMLEKKRGVRKIHLLRIIGLLEADFNTALKFFFSVQMQGASEANESITDEQHGSRKHRQCIDAIMIKLLTFECARIKRSCIAETTHDKRACFDRMRRGLINIHKQKQNVSKNACLSTAKTIRRMKRRVKTCVGVSKMTYQQEKNEAEIDGEIQGKADVPSSYCQQSSIMNRTQKECAPGCLLNSCTMKRSISHHNIMYVDDTDGHVSADHHSNTPIKDAAKKMQASVSSWGKIAQMMGHALAPHKTHWASLAYEFIGGKMRLVRATEEVIVMEDSRGGYSVIDFRAPDQPNGGLGVQCCPDGNQRHQLKSIREKMASICGAVETAYLSETETYQVLLQRLVPKLSYPLHATSLQEKEARSIDSMIRNAFFPKMRFNRNLPSALAYGPEEFGGMEFPEVYTLQDQLQIPYLLKALRWNKTVANNFLVTLDNIQMASGFVTPILEDTTLPIDYVDRGWIISLRDRMSEYNAGVWVEDAWAPKLQRVGDKSLMEVFTNIQGMTPAKLAKINAVRQYLRVITVADLADEAGTHVRDNMLNGEWTAGTDYEWPNQECPPARDFGTFRAAFRKAFCSRVSGVLRAHMSLELDEPLGPWLPVERHTWWNAYRSKDAVYYRGRTGDVLQKFKSTVAGFFEYEKDVKSVPLEASSCYQWGKNYGHISGVI